MSSNIPAKQLYKFIDKFDSEPEFLEFARRELNFVEREINDIKTDYPSNARERKYQLLCLWKKKRGRAATLERLEQLKNDFDTGNEQADAQSQAQPASESGTRQTTLTYSEPGTSQAQPRQVTPQSSTPVKRHAVESSLVTNTTTIQDSQRIFFSVRHNPRIDPPTPGFENVSSIGDQMSELQIHNESHLCGQVGPIKVEPCSRDDIRYIQSIDNAYEMDFHYKGYVLIINNNFKDKPTERIGAGKDVDNMKRLWTDFGCKVNIKEDLNADEICDTLARMAESRQISNYSFVVIFIMSHGDILENRTEVVLGADDAPVTIEQILDQFSNQRCRALAGKPKLFFFQFCRGQQIDKGTQYQDDRNESLFQSLQNHFPAGEVVDRDSSQENFCTRSDMLISYATQSGYVAFRNGKGSWFINAIANIFMKYAHQEHVGDLMIRVRSAIESKTGLTRNENKNVPCKEMSESCNLLIKKLFLYPGYPWDDI